MEEQVGSLWHKLITGVARSDYPQAEVRFVDIAPTLGIVFRALGGEHSAGLKSGDSRCFTTRRNFLKKIAGIDRKHRVAWCNGEDIFFPESIAAWPETELNRNCYLWLAALSVQGDKVTGNWLMDNIALTKQITHTYPGLLKKYKKLVTVHLRDRPSLSSLSAAQRRHEQAIVAALESGADVGARINSDDVFSIAPVPLWLYPPPPAPTTGYVDNGHDETFTSNLRQAHKKRKRKAEYVDHSRGDDGLLAFRLESMFTWSEFVNVTRTHDDDEDKDAEKVADDMDVLSIAKDRSLITSSALKFDLDLPASENDDLVLGEGIRLPEWDYKKRRLVPDRCCLQPMLADQVEAYALPARLKYTSRKLRSQFEAIKPVRVWHKRQQDGDEIDLNAWLEHRAEDKLHRPAEQRVYKSFKGNARDMATLLLADLSFSTDAWVNNQCRVIDVIRDSLFLFAEVLAVLKDRFAIYGFSSRKRSHVRFNMLKNFNEPYSDIARGRVNAIRPGFYTRMGAPIRQATRILANETAAQRLLLLLTDGKPNDLDRYEGRYGIEDTREAIIEARKQGLHPFCITIDEEADDYLPYLFGSTDYLLIHNPMQLPRQLATLYMKLTQ